MIRRLACIFVAFLVGTAPSAASPERVAFLELARRGWVYDLRTALWGRDPESVRMTINGRALSGASLCVVGEPPHPETEAVLTSFTRLLADTFGKPVRIRFAGFDLTNCGTGRTVYLRLYSGPVPLGAFNSDLRWLDSLYDIRLPRDRVQYVVSPAQAATFFGSRGQATHLIVKQPAEIEPDALTRRFFVSILVEELYQAFTFGMDVLHFDRELAFVSKLEEFPVNLRNLPWDSPAFMEAMLASNPNGLCRFDLFMLHALAESPVENTNTPEFLDFIDAHFDDLVAEADATAERSNYAGILDSRCSAGD